MSNTYVKRLKTPFGRISISFFVDGLLESENEEICKIDGHSHSGAVSLREGISFGDIVIFVSFRFA